jgi:hypothetical protein
MADIGNPEIKKNDVSNKDITSTQTAGIGVNLNTTVSSNSTKADITIPIVKINTSQPDDVKYPVEDLIENSKALTGYGKEVAVGALFNCQEKELTKDAFKKSIDDFLKRKVK